MLVSSRSEAEWSDDERAKVLAYRRWELVDRCPKCGGPKAECQDPENMGRYKADLPIRCAYYDALIVEMDQWGKDKRPRAEALIPRISLPRG